MRSTRSSAPSHSTRLGGGDDQTLSNSPWCSRALLLDAWGVGRAERPSLPAGMRDVDRCLRGTRGGARRGSAELGERGELANRLRGVERQRHRGARRPRHRNRSVVNRDQPATHLKEAFRGFRVDALVWDVARRLLERSRRAAWISQALDWTVAGAVAVVTMGRRKVPAAERRDRSRARQRILRPFAESSRQLAAIADDLPGTKFRGSAAITAPKPAPALAPRRRPPRGAPTWHRLLAMQFGWWDVLVAGKELFALPAS